MDRVIFNKIDLSKIKVLSRNGIKWIAMICMIIDHMGYAFFDADSFPYFVCRYLIGRIAFPLFAALFVDGFFRTKHPWKHFFRFLLFAIITEPFFDMLFGVQEQNVMFSWALGWLLLILFDKLESMKEVPSTCLYILEIGFMIVFAVIATFFNFDYIYVGICSMGLCYIAGKDSKCFPFWILCALTALLDGVCFNTYGTLLAVPIAFLYDPSKKCAYNTFVKYSFYAAYPIHIIAILLILFIIKN